MQLGISVEMPKDQSINEVERKINIARNGIVENFFTEDSSNPHLFISEPIRAFFIWLTFNLRMLTSY
jgi:hypothetical protein